MRRYYCKTGSKADVVQSNKLEGAALCTYHRLGSPVYTTLWQHPQAAYTTTQSLLVRRDICRLCHLRATSASVRSNEVPDSVQGGQGLRLHCQAARLARTRPLLEVPPELNATAARHLCGGPLCALWLLTQHAALLPVIRMQHTHLIATHINHGRKWYLATSGRLIDRSPIQIREIIFVEHGSVIHPDLKGVDPTKCHCDLLSCTHRGQ